MFENILYPSAILPLVATSLMGRYTPEEAIDSLTNQFLTASGMVFHVWSAGVFGAVRKLGCTNGVVARLNLECLMESYDEEIVIMSEPTQKLPFLDREGHSFSEDGYKYHEHFYASRKSLRKGKKIPGLADDQKKELLNKLELSGVDIAKTREDAYAGHWKIFDRYTVEQIIISRLAFMILISIASKPDGTTSGVIALDNFLTTKAIGHDGQAKVH